MKVIYYTIVVFQLLFIGCSDFLEESSKDEVRPSEVSDMEQLLLGNAYMEEDDLFYNIMDIFTDDVQCNGLVDENDQEYFNLLKWRYIWASDMFTEERGGDDEAFWKYPYKKILGCNIVLDYLDKVNGDDHLREALRGEALVLRAYYYLTLVKPGAKGEGSLFASKNEAIYAYQTKNLDLQAEITVRLSKEVDGKTYTKRVVTTVGRILFNNVVPQNLGYVDRSNPDNICDLEINYPVKKNDLGKIVGDCYDKFGTTECSKLVDRLKETGYKYSTLASVSVNMYDIQEPKEKAEILKEAEGKVQENEKLLRRGLITLEEKIDKNVAIWNEAVTEVQKALSTLPELAANGDNVTTVGENAPTAYQVVTNATQTNGRNATALKKAVEEAVKAAAK